MKQKLILLSIFIITILFFTSCQENTENKIIIGQGSSIDDQIITTIISEYINNHYPDIEIETASKESTKTDIENGTIDMGTVIINDFESEKQSYQDDDLILTTAYGYYKYNEFVVDSVTAETYSINNISDLTLYGWWFTFGTTQEYIDDPAGLTAFQAIYPVSFRQIVPYENLDAQFNGYQLGEINALISSNFNTNITTLGLKELTDDLSYFPKTTYGLLVNRECLDNNPELLTSLQELDDFITTKEMQDMIVKVNIQGQSTEEVAIEFLTNHDLLK
jgi:glycine betaine/choline ABC-type transport system substrate-binding protein